jgi:hypothetical protein
MRKGMSLKGWLNSITEEMINNTRKMLGIRRVSKSLTTIAMSIEAVTTP